MESRQPEFVFGTAQLGMPYGIANRDGMPNAEAAQAILQSAALAGIRTFDTARAYGESEVRLGETFADDSDSPILLTKLAPLSDVACDADRLSVEHAVNNSVQKSIANLGQCPLSGILLHRAKHLTEWDGAVWSRLKTLQETEFVERLGVSVQDPDELELVLNTPGVQHVQLPFNLLDQRWHKAGVIDALRKRSDIIVHIRSIYLQGLLVTDDPALWPSIKDVEPTEILEILNEHVTFFKRKSLSDLCLAYARAQDWVHGIVVGMETLDQLNTNIDLFSQTPLTSEQCLLLERALPEVPDLLVNPTLWPQG